MLPSTKSGALADLDIRLFEGDDEHIASAVYALLRAVILQQGTQRSVRDRLKKEPIWSNLLLGQTADINVLPFIKALPDLQRPTLGKHLHNYIRCLIEKLPETVQSLFKVKLVVYDVCDSCGHSTPVGEAEYAEYRVGEDSYALSPETRAAPRTDTGTGAGTAVSGIGIDDVDAFTKTLDSVWLRAASDVTKDCPRCHHQIKSQVLRTSTPRLLVFRLDDTFLGEIPRSLSLPGLPSANAHLRLVMTHPSARTQGTGLVPRASTFVASMSRPGMFDVFDTDHPGPMNKFQSRAKRVLACGRGFDSGYDDVPSVVIYEVDPVTEAPPILLSPATLNMTFNTPQPTMSMSDLARGRMARGGGSDNNSDEDYSYDADGSMASSYTTERPSQDHASPSIHTISPFSSPVKRSQMPVQNTYSFSVPNMVSGAGYEKTGTLSKLRLIWNKMNIWWKVMVISGIPVLLLLILDIVALCQIALRISVGSNGIYDSLTTKRLIVGSSETNVRGVSDASKSKLVDRAEEVAAVPVMIVVGGAQFSGVVTKSAKIDKGKALTRFNCNGLAPGSSLLIPNNIEFSQLNVGTLTLGNITVPNASLSANVLTVGSSSSPTPSGLTTLVIKDLRAYGVLTQPSDVSMSLASLSVVGVVNGSNVVVSGTSASFSMTQLSTPNLTTPAISANSLVVLDLKGVNLSFSVNKVVLGQAGTDFSGVVSVGRLRAVASNSISSSVAIKGLHVVGSLSLGNTTFKSITANETLLGKLKTNGLDVPSGSSLHMSQVTVTETLRIAGMVGISPASGITMNSAFSLDSLTSLRDISAANISVGSSTDERPSTAVGDAFTTERLLLDDVVFDELALTGKLGKVTVTSKLTISDNTTVDLTSAPSSAVVLPTFETLKLSVSSITKTLKLDIGAELVLDKFSFENLKTFSAPNMSVNIPNSTGSPTTDALFLIATSKFSLQTGRFKALIPTTVSSTVSVLSANEVSPKTAGNSININGAQTVNLSQVSITKSLTVKEGFDSCTKPATGTLKVSEPPTFSELTTETFKVTTTALGTKPNLTITTLAAAISTLKLKGTVTLKGKIIVTGDLSSSFTGTIDIPTLSVKTSMSISGVIDGNLVFDGNLSIAKGLIAKYGYVYQMGSSPTTPVGSRFGAFKKLYPSGIFENNNFFNTTFVEREYKAIFYQTMPKNT